MSTRRSSPCCDDIHSLVFLLWSQPRVHSSSTFHLPNRPHTSQALIKFPSRLNDGRNIYKINLRELKVKWTLLEEIFDLEVESRWKVSFREWIFTSRAIIGKEHIDLVMQFSTTNRTINCMQMSRRVLVALQNRGNTTIWDVYFAFGFCIFRVALGVTKIA